MFSFVAQRKHGAREILEAGPLAKAESSRRNGSGECCLSRPVVSLNFPTSPYNGLPTSRAEDATRPAEWPKRNGEELALAETDADAWIRKQVGHVWNRLSDYLNREPNSDRKEGVTMLPICQDAGQFRLSEATGPDSTAAHSGWMRRSLVVTAERHNVATLKSQEKVRCRVHAKIGMTPGRTGYCVIPESFRKNLLFSKIEFPVLGVRIADY